VGQLGCLFFRCLGLLVPLLLSSFSLAHDAVPLHQAGAQHSQSPIDAVMGGDAYQHARRRSEVLVNTAHFTNKSQNCQIQIEDNCPSNAGQRRLPEADMPICPLDIE
jgi:hypothetical protein